MIFSNSYVHESDTNCTLPITIPVYMIKVICLTLIHIMKFSFLFFRSIQVVRGTRKRRLSIVHGYGACNNNIHFDQIICCMIYSCCIALNWIALDFKQKSCIKRTIIQLFDEILVNHLYM